MPDATTIAEKAAAQAEVINDTRGNITNTVTDWAKNYNQIRYETYQRDVEKFKNYSPTSTVTTKNNATENWSAWLDNTSSSTTTKTVQNKMPPPRDPGEFQEFVPTVEPYRSAYLNNPWVKPPEPPPEETGGDGDGTPAEPPDSTPSGSPVTSFSDPNINLGMQGTPGTDEDIDRWNYWYNDLGGNADNAKFYSDSSTHTNPITGLSYDMSAPAHDEVPVNFNMQPQDIDPTTGLAWNLETARDLPSLEDQKAAILNDPHLIPGQGRIYYFGKYYTPQELQGMGVDPSTGEAYGSG